MLRHVRSGGYVKPVENTRTAAIGLNQLEKTGGTNKITKAEKTCCLERNPS